MSSDRLKPETDLGFKKSRCVTGFFASRVGLYWMWSHLVEDDTKLNFHHPAPKSANLGYHQGIESILKETQNVFLYVSRP